MTWISDCEAMLAQHLFDQNAVTRQPDHSPSTAASATLVLSPGYGRRTPAGAVSRIKPIIQVKVAAPIVAAARKATFELPELLSNYLLIAI